MSVKRLVALVAVVAAFWPGSSGRADEIKVLGGKTITGTIVGVNAGNVEIKTGDGVVKVPVAKVLELNLRAIKAGGGNYSEVRLIDDTVLKATKVAFAEKSLSLTLTSGQAVVVPLEAVTAVIHDAGNPQFKKQWAAILRNKARQDQIVLLSEGELAAVEGLFGAISPKDETIKFTPKETNKPQAMPLARPRGFLFFRVQLAPAEPVCRVLDVAGNAVTARKIAYDGKEYSVTTMFGAKLAFKADLVAKLDFNFGKLTYLSEMEPAKVIEKSAVGLVSKYGRDKNLDKGDIILQKKHEKGISMHAYTELEYDLAGKYKEFKALAGVDTAVGADSHAEIKIYGDGVLYFKYAVNAKEVKQVAFSVKDVQTLRIVVSSSNFLDLHDHATLADARVSQ